MEARVNAPVDDPPTLIDQQHYGEREDSHLVRKPAVESTLFIEVGPCRTFCAKVIGECLRVTVKIDANDLESLTT